MRIKDRRLKSRPVAWIALLICLAVIGSGCGQESDMKAIHQERARRFTAEGKIGEAVLEWLNVVQLDPRDEEAHLTLGDLYWQQGKFRLAAQSYGAVINANPENLTAHLKMGKLFLAAKRTMDARMAAKRILDEQPDNIEALHLLASVQLQENNPAAAIRTLKETVERVPDHISTRLFLANVLDGDGKTDEAEQVLLGALTLRPENPTPYAELALFYASKGRWEKTGEVLGKMPVVRGEALRQLARLATMCEDQGRGRLALLVHEKAVAAAGEDDAAPLMALSGYYARRGDYTKALETAHKALGIVPDHATILSFIASLHLDMGDLDTARATADQAIAANADNLRAQYVRGRVALEMKDFSGALTYFDLVLNQEPENAMAHYYRAMALLARGSGESREGADLFRAAAGYMDDADAYVEKQAEESLLKAVEINPELVEAHLALAGIYLRAKRIQRAKLHIGKARLVAPGHPQAVTMLASLLLLEGDLKGAEFICKKVLEKNPDLLVWRVRLAIVYRTMKRSDEALAECRKIIDKDPKMLDALRLMAEIYMERGKPDAALAVLDGQRPLMEGDPTAQAFVDNLTGTILVSLGKREEGINRVSRAVTLNPDLVAPRMVLASFLIKEGRSDEAIDQYKRLLDRTPDYLPACMALGVINHRLKNYKLAEKYYRRALTIRTGFASAANNLAYLLADTGGNINEAMSLVVLAMEKAPEDPTVRDTLGWVYYKKGNYFNAIHQFEQSLRMRPDVALTNFHLGLAYYQNGEFEKARKQMQKALELDPEFEGAAEARTLLDR